MLNSILPRLPVTRDFCVALKSLDRVGNLAVEYRGGCWLRQKKTKGRLVSCDR